MTTDSLGIVVSAADETSVRIGEQLRELAQWEETTDDDRSPADGGGTVFRRPGVEMRCVEELHLHASGIADAFDDVGLIAFASRHSGDTGPLLTAHHTGNFGPAEHGGDDRTLARAAPLALRRAVASLDEYAPAEYDVGMECTHHGPTAVGAPSLFVEHGSGPEQWGDTGATRAVARAILDLAGADADAPAENGTRRHLVGFGGGHYAPRYGRVLRETDWAVGHVAADWCLDDMGDPGHSTDVLAAAFAESAAEYALLESDRPALADAIEELGHRVVGETWVRETAGVPLALVESLEDAIAPVDAGLRFGVPASRDEDSQREPVVGAVPDELVSAVNAVDPDATLAAVDRIALAYDTENSGSRFDGPVALARAADESSIVEAFATILATDYEDVTVTDEAIVVRRREFDPDLARDAGVEPGPAFGRLADGEAVTVDGDRVTPQQVTVERERALSASVVRD